MEEDKRFPLEFRTKALNITGLLKDLRFQLDQINGSKKKDQSNRLKVDNKQHKIQQCKTLECQLLGKQGEEELKEDENKLPLLKSNEQIKRRSRQRSRQKLSAKFKYINEQDEAALKLHLTAKLSPYLQKIHFKDKH